MKITFDPQTRLRTLSERRIDFATDALKVFAGKIATSPDDRFDYGEQRQKTVVWLDGRMVVMIWTERGSARHVISMRYCHAKEEVRLRKQFDDI